MNVEAVVFDLDGVLIDSESTWADARRHVALENGGRWRPDSQRAMMGMSSTEWSRYMHDELGVAIAPAEISTVVVARLERLYNEHLPVLPGAREAVVALARHWPLAVASSANRPLIELALELMELRACFGAVVSSEEVQRGKPAPDVFEHAAHALGVAPAGCVAVEDSSNGIRSAAAAGMAVIAVPNRELPPEPAVLALAAHVLGSLEQLTPALVQGLGARARSTGA